MGIRLIASVRKDKKSVDKVKHFLGMPPELEQGNDHREKLSVARILVLEEKPDGVFLSRYAEDHGFAGDTWHVNVNDAIHQAECDRLSEWREVPPEVDDPMSFALKQAL